MTSKLPSFTIPNKPKSHILFHEFKVFWEGHKKLTLLNWYLVLWTSQNTSTLQKSPPQENCDNYVLQWWVEFNNELGWLFTKEFKVFFILLTENSWILLKVSVIPIPILLSFIHLVALNLLVNNQLNSSLRHIIVTFFWVLFKLLVQK